MNFIDNGIFGFDISHWNDNDNTVAFNDFNKMRDYGASFVIMKAGQKNFEDSDFAASWEGAKQAGLRTASYWFCDVALGGTAQAHTYYDILVKNGWNGEPCAADYEVGGWTDWNELYNFLTTLQELTKLPDHKIWIYTGYPYWMSNKPTNSTQAEWFSKFPLWLAWYTDNPSYVKIPTPWTNLFLWQSGTPAIGIAVGLESIEVDYNKLNGGEQELNYYFGDAGTPVPPPGGNMIYKGTTLVRLNVRDSASYAGNWLLTMNAGDLVEADDIVNGWWHLTSINGVPVTMESWAFQGDTNGYIRLDEVVQPPVASGVCNHTVNVTITIDGVVVVDQSYDV